MGVIEGKEGGRIRTRQVLTDRDVLDVAASSDKQRERKEEGRSEAHDG